MCKYRVLEALRFQCLGAAIRLSSSSHSVFVGVGDSLLGAPGKHSAFIMILNGSKETGKEEQKE